MGGKGIEIIELIFCVSPACGLEYRLMVPMSNMLSLDYS